MEELISYINSTWMTIQEGWYDKEADVFKEMFISTYITVTETLTEMMGDMDRKLSELYDALQEL